MSQAIATGFRTSGSAAKTLTRNPAGTRKPAAAAAGVRAVSRRSRVSGGAGKSSGGSRTHSVIGASDEDEREAEPAIHGRGVRFDSVTRQHMIRMP